MTHRWRTIASVTLVVLVVIASGLATFAILSGDDEDASGASRAADASFAEAARLAPADAQRLLWTDWAGVRAELGVDLDATSSPEQVRSLLDAGFDADLTAASALLSSAVMMQGSFGFSPASLEWELFAQSDTAATLTMRLGDQVGTDTIAAALRTLGYAEPATPDGVWAGDSDLPVAGTVTPELTFIALDADAGLVFASDQSMGVDAAVEAAGAADAAAVEPRVVAALGEPVTALAYTGTEACGALAMANADPAEQAAGEALVEQAGRVNPVTAFAIGSEVGGAVRVALGFDDEGAARTNADTRAVLAAGPAPGQGGDFADRFTVRQVSADGTVVRLDLDPVEGAFVVSDLSTGPVLFATC